MFRLVTGALVFLTLALSAVPAGADITVAQGGGGDYTTIQAAYNAARIAGSDQVITILDNSFYDEAVWSDSSQGGYAVTIQAATGAKPSLFSFGVYNTGGNKITLKNLTFDDRSTTLQAAGAVYVRYSANVTVDGCTFNGYSTATGLGWTGGLASVIHLQSMAAADVTTIKNSTFNLNAGAPALTLINEGWGSTGTDVITGNVFNVAVAGVQALALTTGSSAISAGSATIEGNIFSGAANAYYIRQGYSPDLTTFNHNTFYNCGTRDWDWNSGALLVRSPDFGAIVKNNLFYNDGPYGGLNAYDNTPTAIYATNNGFSQTPTPVGYWAYGYKNLSQLNAYTGAAANFQDSTGVNPFVDPANGDFHLKTGCWATSGADDGGFVGALGTAVVTVFNWSGNRSGDFNTVTNWSPPTAAPNDNTLTAVFGPAITAPQTVYTNTAVTIKSVQFDNANKYVIAGAGSLTLAADGGNASIAVLQGTHVFQLPVTLAVDGTDVSVATTAALIFDGALNLAGNTLTKTGAGTMFINNKLILNGGQIVVSEGSVELSGQLVAALGSIPSGSLTLLDVGAGSVGGTFYGLNEGAEVDLGYGGTTYKFTISYTGGTGNDVVLNLIPNHIPGDINGDNIVDQADYTVWYNHYGQTPAAWADGDVTGDSIVDQADYTVWYNNYGSTGGNVPEPMTMALLAIGGVAMLRRRK